MCSDDYLVSTFRRSRRRKPLWWRSWLHIPVHMKVGKALEEFDEEIWRFVVRKLSKMELAQRWWKDKQKSTCWPIHILGPALKGINMKGFGIKYFWALSSIKRSGSNSKAEKTPIKVSSSSAVYKNIPSAPHKSSRRCMRNTLYTHLDKLWAYTISNTDEVNILDTRRDI